MLMPILYGLDEGFAWYDNVGGGVDYGHFHRRVGLGNMKGRVGLWFDLVICHGQLSLHETRSLKDTSN